MLLFALLVLTACSSGPVTPRATFDAEGPLTGYGACVAPTAGPVLRPVGMVLPEGAVLTEGQADGPVTQVSGFVPLTPVQLRQHYEQRDDVVVLSVEDEILESEVLLEADGYRTFVKATVACERGSRFVALTAANVDASTVPTPAGTPPA